MIPPFPFPFPVPFPFPLPPSSSLLLVVCDWTRRMTTLRPFVAEDLFRVNNMYAARTLGRERRRERERESERKRGQREREQGESKERARGTRSRESMEKDGAEGAWREMEHRERARGKSEAKVSMDSMVQRQGARELERARREIVRRLRRRPACPGTRRRCCSNSPLSATTAIRGSLAR